MSFASDTKSELARIETSKKCCMLAEISGFLRVSGSIGLAGGGKLKVIITTDNAGIARHYIKLLKEYFAIETKLDITKGGGVGRNRNVRKYTYTLVIDAENHSEEILRECGLLLIKEGNNYLPDGIYEGIIKSKCCKKAYMRGVFLGAGTMSNPEKGYDLEMVLSTERLAGDIRKLINSFVDMDAKIVKRGKKHVVYIKKADYISDMLAIMGASNQVFAFEEIRIKKAMVNTVKRTVNCDNANMDRTIDASMRHIDAINKIAESKGLKILPIKLLEVATLRLENPHITITALGEMCNPPLKKSGVNNRLKKIEEIANRL